MYLLENNKKQTDNNEKEIIDELNNDIIKEENKNEEINSEKVQKEENFNKIESQNEENKEELIVNEKKSDLNINKTNININLGEITIENNKTKSANHEIIPECINNCINWTLRAHINKKNNPKEFKYNHNFQGKNLFFPKLEYSILNAMNNSSCFEKCFPKNYNFENKKKVLEKLKQESIYQINNVDKNMNEKKEKHLSENASLKNILDFKSLYL